MDINILNAPLEKDLEGMLKNIQSVAPDVNVREDKELNGNTI
tara:strand:+ start:712 stop:837 length:126 start_codon:yes stop_codon:yes gene_type:complete